MVLEMLGWLFLGLLLGLFFGILTYRIVTGRRRPDRLTLAEYWVYVEEPRVPKIEAVMTRMVSENPHTKPGSPCISNREGMLFTDLRLHYAAVLKSKNPHAFRPDLFSVSTEPTAEVLERLADCPGFLKCRYQCETLLKDQRHLTFLPHMADAFSDLAKGHVVYDPISEEIMTREEFKERISSAKNLESPLFHLRIVWERAEEGWRAVTKGLMKVGRSEWASSLQEQDQEVLVAGLFTKAAHQVFRKPETDWPLELEEYGDTFALSPSGRWVEGRQEITIVRKRKT